LQGAKSHRAPHPTFGCGGDVVIAVSGRNGQALVGMSSAFAPFLRL